MKQLDLPVKETGGGYMPLQPAPDAEAIARAVARLQDPVTRLVEEFFWFWPEQIHGTEDAALKALAQGQTNEAFDLWLKQEREGSEAKVSTHNLAVLYHAVVLDWENLGATGRALTDAERNNCAGWWKEAFKRWKRLSDDTWFWSRLNARIRQLDDPRLTTGTAKRLREALLKALLLVNARLAVRAAEKGDAPEVRRHLEAMRTSGFDYEESLVRALSKDPSQLNLTGLVNDTLREVLKPTRERIEMLCSSVAARAEEDASCANETARQFLKDIWPLLATIDRLLPKDHPLRDGVCGDAADALRGCIVAYGNETADWTACLSLTTAALSLGISQRARTRLEGDVRLVFGMLCSEVASEAEANPKAASRLAERVLDDFPPLIEPLDRLQSQGHPVRQGLHDDIALVARHCVVAYGNATKDWKPCLDLTERILALPIAPSMRERIEGDMKSLRENVEASQCWFCKVNAAQDEAAMGVLMHGDVQQKWVVLSTRYTWRQVTVPVPRCARCEGIHDNSTLTRQVGGFLRRLLSGAPRKPPTLPEVQPMKYAYEFPAIRELQAKGWAVGDKPPGVR